MKYRTVTRKVPTTYTRDGHTVQVEKPQTVKSPVLPVDWRVVALRVAIAIVLALTLGAVGWSTYAIGDILGGGIIGYSAAVIYDLGWAVALLLEYLSMYDRRKRAFPKKLGWGLLVVTMLAIAWHGLSQESGPNWGMAIFGACVSMFAKVLWMGVMRHANADLSPEDEAWVADQMSKAQSNAAVAQMRRSAARITQRATLELLAMEQEEHRLREAFGRGTVVEADASVVEADAAALPQPQLSDLPKTAAVRFVLDRRPDATPDTIASILCAEGVEVDAKYVRQVIKRDITDTESNIVPIHTAKETAR